MVEELVIHLGDCKTGTTALQTTLARRQFSAEGRDLVYPTRFNHMLFGRHVGQGPQHAMGMARKLANRFQASNAEIGVISAEHFEFTPPAHLAALFDGPFKPWRDRVRLIAYIRPHAERFVATFVERLKMGVLDGTMDKFAENIANRPLLYYAPRVADWQAHFGDSYTVRPFIRDQLEDGDVVRDFFSFTFGDTPVLLTHETIQNESLSLEDLMLISYVHRVLKGQGKELDEPHKAFGWYFADILARQPGGSSAKARLHKALAHELQDRYAEDAAALDALAFDGTPMTDRLAAATDNALETAQSFEPRDYHSRKVLRQTAAFAELLGRIMASHPGHFSWAVRPEDFREPLAEVLQRGLRNTRRSAALERRSAIDAVAAKLRAVLRG